MNYYMPRQGKVSGLWRYTCRNDDRIFEVGYCQTDEAGHSPCAGHPSPEEAAEHMKLYALDHMRLDRWDRSVAPCEVCGTTTDRFAKAWHSTFALCPEHLTRDEVAKLLDFTGTVTASW